MKKMFLAAVTALALCSYSYAQDDDDEYEDDDAPAREEAPAIEEDDAPVAKTEKKSKASSGDAFLGLGMGLTDSYQQIHIKYKISSTLTATGILLLNHHGETTYEAAGTEMDMGDDYTSFGIGAGIDYYLDTPVLPTSVGAELSYISGGEQLIASDANSKTTLSTGNLNIDLMFGVHAELVKNFELSGKAGLGFVYSSSTTKTTMTAANTSSEMESSNLSFGLKAGVYATWFFL
jgi:opacity protein-like surface antigen